MSVVQKPLTITSKLVYHSGGIYCRRTINSKSKYKLIFRIDKDFVDFESPQLRVNSDHPNQVKLNLLINKVWIEWEEYTTNLQLGFIPIHKEVKVEPVITVYQALIDYQRRLDEDNKLTSRRKAYNVANLILDYGDKTLDKTNMNYWEGFKKFLLNRRARPNKPEPFRKGTIKRYFGVLKTAIDYEHYNDSRVEKSVHNVRHDGIEVQVKAKLTKEEFLRIKEVELKPELALSRDIFCTQVLLWGTRISDTLMLKPSDLKNYQADFIELKTQKRKTVKLNELAKFFYEKYFGKSPYYVFPSLTLPPSNAKLDQKYRKHIESKTAIINNHLKVIAAKCDIDKNLSTHCARHTFSAWAYYADVKDRHISEMLNHGSVRVTRDYLRELVKSDDLNDQADKIFDFDW